jgi:hypothetical protein
MISYHPTPPNAETPWAYSKDFKIQLTKDLNQIADTMLTNVWSPNIFTNGHRANETFRSSFFLVLDFDDGSFTLKDAYHHFIDYRCIIGTTKSHGVVSEKNPTGADRFRVVIPWEKTISDPLVYSYNMEQVVDKYDCDTSCVDPARFYFPCKEITVCQDGEDYYPYTVLPVSERYRADHAELLATQLKDVERYRTDLIKYGRLKPWHERFLRKGILPEEGYSRRWCLFRIAFYLYVCEMKEDMIFRLLVQGNYDKTGIVDIEKDVRARMRSAKKKAQSFMEKIEKENPSAKVLPLLSRASEHPPKTP